MHGDQLIADRYRLLERVGSGGMGVVWRARDERLDREVALKQARLSDAVSGRKLRREARLAASVLHPNVVTFFDVAAEGDELWLVMEYVPARSLAEVLAEEGRQPPRTVAEIGVQIAAGLAAVHAHGIEHRDVKPGNVLITLDGQAKLTDFSISRSVRAEETVTDSPVIGGTPGYIAPEVAQGHLPSAAADVFSLGATLYALAEGAPPFAGGTEFATIRRAAEGVVPPAAHAGSLAPVLARLMRSDPAERPSATVAGELLAEQIGTLPVLPPAPRRGLPAGAVVLVAVVVLGVAFLVARPGSGDPVAQPPKLGIGADPRAADPCRLMDAAPLRPFGDAEMDADYGNFDRCDVILHRGEDLQTDVKLEFEDPPAGGATPAGTQTRSGPFAVFGEAPQDGGCVRLVHLQDRYLVRISVDPDEGYSLDPCKVADIAVGSATKVLAVAGAPPRATPTQAGSLGQVDACSLVDPGAAGVAQPVRIQPGFGKWSCDWDSAASSRAVTVMFDRDQPPDGRDGQLVRVGGHDAYLKADEYADHTCQAILVFRGYTDAHGESAVEQIKLVLHGDPPSERLCAPVTTLAGEVAAKLPRT
ncbi:protein kinase-like protein [Amycolatopsis sulphurea]|uniref:non-specific serine/threonine protein kinase n=1 Tax=Amycolatopsis sulphurea TaxID=76022 RepID=A0A2A9G2B0_9PSEU|nr:serine/threonine-protein kinase [Amycolatopsis sulphurea]PFG57076.1 protein kinase-like protein [Amycolatopsis sulphurea]